MAIWRKAWNVHRVVVAATLMATCAGGLAARPSLAAPLDQIGGSLKLVPEDAAFYSASFRDSERVEAVLHSNAWKKLIAMPAMQMGMALYNMQAANPKSVPGKIQAALKDPEVRKLIDLGLDMFSQEVFCYGDQSTVQSVELLQRVVGAMRYGPMVMEVSGKAKEIDSDKRQAVILLRALAENPDQLQVPNMVMGFKLGNKELAAESLEKLQQAASEALDSEPILQGRLKKTEIAGHEYLTLSLDGQMIPWDKIPAEEIEKAKQLEAKPGDVDKLIAQVKKMTLVVAVGVREDYLLVSMGATTDALAKLGAGKPIADRPELKPLEKFADKQIASIGYFSKALADSLTNQRRNINDLMAAGDEALVAAKLTDEQKDQIRKDALALADEIKQRLPEPGPIMAFSFQTDQGFEGYRYDWGTHPQLDGSKRLDILEHLGGNPLFAVAGRGKSSPQDYDMTVKWLKVGYGYFRQYGLPCMSEEDRNKFEQFATQVAPLLERIDKANREAVIPAFADSQAALVLDAKMTSKHYVESMPATEEPMPMFELGVIAGVSDAKLLRKACREYTEVCTELVDVIRKLQPGAIPDEYSIPAAQKAKGEQGTTYSYPLSAEWGVDPQIAPNGGLSKTMGVVSLSPSHTARLLKATPLTIGGVLAETDRPLAAAVLLDWAGLIDAVTPWVDLGLQKAVPASDDGSPQVMPMAAVTGQVHTVLDLLRVLRGVTAVSYFENDALVTHSLVVIQDVAE